MSSDTLSTLAQVYPVLLLALAWDSGFLERLREQRRVTRRQAPDGDVLFWTKRRVRLYALVVFNLLIIDIAVDILTLAGILPQTPVTTPLLVAGLVLALGTLATRVSVDVLEATGAGPLGTTPTAAPPVVVQLPAAVAPAGQAPVNKGQDAGAPP